MKEDINKPIIIDVTIFMSPKKVSAIPENKPKINDIKII